MKRLHKNILILTAGICLASCSRGQIAFEDSSTFDPEPEGASPSEELENVNEPGADPLYRAGDWTFATNLVSVSEGRISLAEPKDHDSNTFNVAAENLNWNPVTSAAECVGCARPPRIYLRFDESVPNSVDGNDIQNYGSSEIDGQDFNNPTYGVPGRFGTALSFDGIDQYIDFGEKIIDHNNAYTLSVWIYPEYVGGESFMGILGEGVGANRAWGLILEDDGEIFIHQMEGTSFADRRATGVVLGANEWHHVAVIRDLVSETFTMVVNGTVVVLNDNTITYGRNNSPPEFNVGRNYTNYFKGRVDELAVWDRAFTVSDAQALYQRSTALPTDYRQTIESRLFDFGSPQSIDNITVNLGFPYGLALPPQGAVSGNVETQFSSGNIDMTDNVLLYRFDQGPYDTTPDAILDFSGRNNYGTNGSVSLLADASGPQGNAVVFDEASDVVTVADDANLDEFDDFTISTWVKVNDLPTANASRILSKDTDQMTLSDAFAILITRGYRIRARVEIANTAYELTSGDREIPHHKTWTHVAVTRKQTEWRLYVDGEQIAYDNNLPAGSIDSSSTPLVIGKHARLGDRNIYASIDETAIWRRELSAVSIKDIYRRGINRIQFQIQACDDSSCEGDDWLGPDGSGNTWFEQNSWTNTADFQLDVSSLALSSRYFRYRMRLSSSDEIVSVPSLKEVSISSDAFNDVTFQLSESVSYDQITSINFSGSAENRYQISTNGGESWLYFADGMWQSSAGLSQNANDEATLEANANLIPANGNLSIRAFLSRSENSSSFIGSVDIDFTE